MMCLLGPDLTITRFGLVKEELDVRTLGSTKRLP